LQFSVGLLVIQYLDCVQVALFAILTVVPCTLDTNIKLQQVGIIHDFSFWDALLGNNSNYFHDQL